MTGTVAHLAGLAGLGILVGAINSSGGGGGLIVYPALIAFGVPALAANHTNTVAQTPSYFAIAGAYRDELTGQRDHVRGLLPAALAGAGAGVAILELAPADAFRVLAPGLITFGALLLALQPQISRALGRQALRSTPHPAARLAVGVCCAYAAYFGVAAGVVLLGVLTIALTDTIRHINAVNRLLIAIANLLAAAVFVAIGPVSWAPVAVLIPTTTLGGWIGARTIRRLDPIWIRWLHLLVGTAASAYMILTVWV